MRNYVNAILPLGFVLAIGAASSATASIPPTDSSAAEKSRCRVSALMPEKHLTGKHGSIVGRGVIQCDRGSQPTACTADVFLDVWNGEHEKWETLRGSVRRHTKCPRGTKPLDYFSGNETCRGNSIKLRYRTVVVANLVIDRTKHPFVITSSPTTLTCS